MKILIVSATHGEIEKLVSSFKHKDNISEKLKSFTYRDLTIDVLITGVGMVSTAFWLGKYLTSNDYDLALNFGIAGSFDKDIELGSVVNIVEDKFSEMGAEDGQNFLPATDLQLINLENFVLVNDSKIKNPAINNLLKVNGITVNKVHGNNESIKKTKTLYNPETESMEGAAFLFACLNEKIPCAQIRAISNFIETRNKENWNIKLAIDNLNKKAKEIVENIDL